MRYGNTNEPALMAHTTEPLKIWGMIKIITWYMTFPEESVKIQTDI
ncbi:hypothetical protein Ct9H90mP29_21240 [bacterium]|nr:MAG: hypothetical protein Ct9H90mP29_21240 [bacterium]